MRVDSCNLPPYALSGSGCENLCDLPRHPLFPACLQKNASEMPTSPGPDFQEHMIRAETARHSRWAAADSTVSAFASEYLPTCV